MGNKNTGVPLRSCQALYMAGCLDMGSGNSVISPNANVKKPGVGI